MLKFQKLAVKTVCGLPYEELDYALHKRVLGFSQHTVLRSVRCSCRSAQGSKGQTALPPALVRARLVRRAGLLSSSVLVACGLVVAVEGELYLPTLPVWAVAGTSTVLAVPTIALALAKAVFKDNLHIELHDGQLHVEWVPVSGITCRAEAVEVRLCGDRRGRGCFAAQRIGSGTYLGNYEGELLDEGEFWARYPNGMADYCMRIDNTWTVDGAVRARDVSAYSACFINHSRTRWNVKRRTHRSELRVALFAARDIERGEELLLDYGKLYWRGREKLEML